MSKIMRIIGGALFAGVLSTTTGCYDNSREISSIDNQLREIMENRPIDEYNNASSTWRKDYAGVADAQRTLDFEGYRNIFEGTKAAKDSAFVADYNRVLASTHLDSSIDAHNPMLVINGIIQNTQDSKVSVLNAVKRSRQSNHFMIEAMQHSLDSGKVANVLEKHNLMTDSMRTAFDSINDLTRPLSKGIKWSEIFYKKIKK